MFSCEIFKKTYFEKYSQTAVSDLFHLVVNIEKKIRDAFLGIDPGFHFLH